MLVALACTILTFLISNPAGAQQEADPLKGQPVQIDTNSVGPIAVAGCEETAGETASITVDDDDQSQVFTNGDGFAFQFGQEGITITAEGDGTVNIVGTGEVVSSRGVTCGGGGRQRANNDDTTNDGTARTADELASLSCDELLALFRGEGGSGQQYGAGSGSGEQYGDAAFFADADVRARIEVCLEEEIVEGTGIDEDLPDTGGLSLLALAVLGLVSAAAGLSVIRGGRR
jgi:hypothetical protein